MSETEESDQIRELARAIHVSALRGRLIPQLTRILLTQCQARYLAACAPENDEEGSNE